MNKLSLEDMQRYRDLFVKPMVDAVRQEMLTHVTPVAEGQKKLTAHLESLDTKVAVIQRNQARALLGWSAYATLIAAGMAAAWGWVRGKLHWS